MVKRARKSLSALGCLAFLMSATPGLGEPIRSIFIQDVGTDPAPLSYTAAGGGVLSIEMESFTVLVERLVGGETVNEFFSDASFVLTASMVTDDSSPPLAFGQFEQVSFELRDSGDDLLLAGALSQAGALDYGEALVPDTMFVSSAPIDVTGGALAPDFDVQAIAFGIGFQIDPGTSTIDSLDTDHSGSVQLNLLPIPEPSALVIGLAVLALGRRRAAVWRRGR